MARIKVLKPIPQSLEGRAALEYLEAQQIGYEQWDVSAVPQELLGFDKMDQGRERLLLEVWRSDIERLMQFNGYQTADVLAVSDETVANLDALLDRFRPEHYHTEDEVRFVVAGHGLFGIHRESPEAVFEVHVGPGDLLKVPRGVWHWFDLAADRRIQCVRLFQDTTGWAPHYRPGKTSS